MWLHINDSVDFCRRNLWKLSAKMMWICPLNVNVIYSSEILLSLRTGRIFSPYAVFILTDRTTLSEPGYTSITFARGQRPRGVKSSKIQTKSWTFKFWFTLCHLERFCGLGRYSLINRFQKCWARICDVFQDLVTATLLWEKTPEGRLIEGLPKRKWFGVKGSGSFISLETFVNGREFMLDSISQVNVDSVSSVSVLEPITL